MLDQASGATARQPRRRNRHLPAVALAGLVVMLQAATPVGAGTEPVSEGDVLAAMRARDSLGLVSTREHVTRLLEETADVGSRRWGFPLTATEEAELDLYGRMRYAHELEREVLPYARGLRTYGGASFDQQDRGRLILYLTDLDPVVIDRLNGMLPEDGPRPAYRLVPHSFAELDRAYGSVEDEWHRFGDERDLLGYALDESDNRLRIDVTPESLDRLQGQRDELESVLGVPVVLRGVGPARDLACNNSRTDCDPLKAGAKVSQGALGNGDWCTLGFLVTKPGATPVTQWLTAGHCGYTGSSNWYNYGMQNYGCCSDGKIGAEKANEYDPSSSYIRDVMRVGVQQPPGTNVMIGQVVGEPNPSEITDPDPPVEDQVLCMSWGNSDQNECGRVISAQASWKSDTVTPNPTIHGASLDTYSNDTLIGGDSGSPIYSVYRPGPTINFWYYTPVGIADSERDASLNQYRDVYFAKVEWAVNHWDLEMYH